MSESQLTTNWIAHDENRWYMMIFPSSVYVMIHESCCPALQRPAILPDDPLVGVEIIVEAWSGVLCRTTLQSWSQIIKKLIWFWWSFHWTVTHDLDKPMHESDLSCHHLASIWRHTRTSPGKLVYWRCPNQQKVSYFHRLLVHFCEWFFLHFKGSSYQTHLGGHFKLSMNCWDAVYPMNY